MDQLMSGGLDIVGRNTFHVVVAAEFAEIGGGVHLVETSGLGL
jgi:hypothetical protein